MNAIELLRTMQEQGYSGDELARRFAHGLKENWQALLSVSQYFVERHPKPQVGARFTAPRPRMTSKSPEVRARVGMVQGIIRENVDRLWEQYCRMGGSLWADTRWSELETYAGRCERDGAIARGILAHCRVSDPQAIVRDVLKPSDLAKIIESVDAEQAAA